MSEQQPFSEPPMCDRCRALGCPSAIACGDCYQVQIESLRERVRELEEGIRRHLEAMNRNGDDIFEADDNLWRLIEKKEGKRNGN